MGLIIYGVVAWVIGNITKIKILETLGYYMIIGGVILFGLQFVGISLPIPIGAF
jgi:hypothetical protein